MGIFQQLWLQVYENVVMSTFPNFHDGFFDGLWASENKSVHLFLRTSNGERSTIVLNEVERLNTSNFMAGNIILDVLLVEPEKLTIAHIEQLYQLQPIQAELAQQLLGKAQQRGLLALEINPSYGAECVVLFRAAEVLPNHVLPQQTTAD